MAAPNCENKYITLLDLARQSKIITGDTACFDGKIQAGLPFSGYPTGVDVDTMGSIGILNPLLSGSTCVFSGNTGTTLFDVSNPISPTFSPIFSSLSGDSWTNPIFSANTTGLTLPITVFSADTQIIGPLGWIGIETGMTGDHIIDTLVSAYTLTYTFQVEDSVSGAPPTYLATQFSGHCGVLIEGFTAGTLDYKGPVDYVKSREDATIDNRLITKKLRVTGGASASTIGYVLKQIDEIGSAAWRPDSGVTADTNTFVVSGLLDGSDDLILTYNTAGIVPAIDLSDLRFTGNTSGDCITDIHVSNIHSCSPLNINPLDEGNVYFGSTSGLTVDMSDFGIDLRLGIGTTIPTEKLEVKDGNILVEHDQNSSTQIQIKNMVGGGFGQAQLSFGVSGNTATAYGGLVSFGVNSIPAGTFLGPVYLPNSINFITAGGNMSNRQHINIGSRRGTDAQTRFFGGSHDFTDASLLGIFYTSGLTITDMVNTDTLRVRDGAIAGHVLTSDASGIGTWQASSGGGLTIDPYNNVGSASTLTWDVSGTSTNYEITLTGNTTLTMSNVRNGDYGTLIIHQDVVGGWTLSFTIAFGPHLVVNGGGGTPTLTATAGATDILSFTYNGTKTYWTVGPDYT